MRIQRAHVGERPRDCRRAVLVNHRRVNILDHRGHVVHSDRGRSRVGTRVVVGQRHADRIHVAGSAARVVVQILVRQGERLTLSGRCTVRVRLHIVGRKRVAPIHHQRERVQRTRIADRAGQHGHSVLADRCHRVQDQRRCHVVHLDRGRIAVAERIVICHRGVDGIHVAERIRRVVVQVLVRQGERLALRRRRAVRVSLDIVGRKRIAPIHHQRERVQRTRIANRTGQRGHSVLVDRGHRIQDQRRCHVVDRHLQG